jgi:hypothetical protein
MRSHLLRFLEILTIGQVNHDPGWPESMQPILVAIRAWPLGHSKMFWYSIWPF